MDRQDTVVKTLNEMMEARNLSPLVYEEKNDIFDSSEAVILKNDVLIAVLVNIFNSEILTQVLTYCKNRKIDHAIIVDFVKSTRPQKGIKDSSEVEIESFSHKQLLFNITKHELVPKHVRVDKTIYSNEKMWKIHLSDAVVRFYNFRIGDIIQVGTHEFRVVVADP